MLQDGPAAGQTIPHVHIHCVPRHFKDLERNDEVYDRIDDAEQDELSARQRCARSLCPKLMPSAGAAGLQCKWWRDAGL